MTMTQESSSSSRSFPDTGTAIRDERLKASSSIGSGDNRQQQIRPSPKRTISLSYPSATNSALTSSLSSRSGRRLLTLSSGGSGGGTKTVTFAPEDFYSWFPPGISPSQVDQYFKQLPSAKTPRIRSLGEKYRDFQLYNQIPIQDISSENCLFLEPWFKYRFDRFVQERNIHNLDVGFVQTIPLNNTLVCKKCGKCGDVGQVAVFSSKFPPGTWFHPACFICSVCNELLVDLIHCFSGDQLYCQRHFAQTIRPRCASCDELIFSDEATRAMDKDWHSNHFNCWQCDESLVAQRYVTKEEHSYCIRCYESKFCSQCDECNQIIGIDSKDLSYREKHWHEACFNCTKCGNSLVDKSFGAKSEKLYCVDCYDELFAVRCEGCNTPFKSGTKKLEYKGHQWHEQCFLCDGCKVPIGSNPFVPKESENFCSKCYEDRFANKCTKCTGVISTGGVTYQNSHFHTECLLCNNCNVQLAGQRFSKTPDGRMLCTECVCTLFARKCAACPNPIAGGSGIKFIAFEERNWHHDCFNCVECKTSLVGRGFMTEGQDIICSDCAKAKLAAA